MSLLETLTNIEHGKVGDFYAITKKPRQMTISPEQEVPFVPMDAIPQNGRYSPRLDYKSWQSITSGTYFEKGDVLIGKITPSFENGKQALMNELSTDFGYATTEVIPLHPIAADADKRLLFYYLLHPEIREFVAERMEGATGRQRVSESVLLDLPYPRFSPTDEKTIADCLELVQEAKELEEQAEKLAQALKASAMHTLFSRGLRGEPQRDSELGPVPESWEVGKLGELVQFQRGFDITKSSQVDGKVPVISSGGIRSFHSEAAVKGPGVVLGRKGSIGSIYYTDDDYWPHDTTLWSRDFFDNHPKFIYYRLQPLDFKRLDSGATNPALNRNFLHEEVISWPEYDEQAEIVGILDAIDQKIDLHRRKRAVLEELFKSLLHKLMTGEVRVADLDLSALDSVRQSAAQEATHGGN